MTNKRPPASRDSNRPSLHQTQGDSQRHLAFKQGVDSSILFAAVNGHLKVPSFGQLKVPTR
jgi:hypothetical protein